MSRLKKKEESMFLNKIVRAKDDQYKALIKCIDSVIDNEQKQIIINYIPQ